MPVTEGTGKAQVLNSACMTPKAIFSRFIIEKKRKTKVN